jgi:hypothetical protein
MTTLFTSPSEWAGGGYELALEYSASAQDAHKAVIALWSHRLIAPGYGRKDAEPEDQSPLTPDELAIADHVYGRCFLGDNVAVAACSVVITYDHGPTWLYFGFPIASLRRAYPVGAYPFDDGSPLVWRVAVDGWLRRIAQDVFDHAPFQCALIGHEPEESVADDLSTETIPATRWDGILMPSPEGLAWFPPTEGFPHTFNGKNSSQGA